MDNELLKQGFHIAYLDVANLFGSPQAISYGNKFYEELTKQHGFQKKVALEGVSRGGLFIYNWALANPEKVSCIYADTPLCVDTTDFFRIRECPVLNKQSATTDSSQSDLLLKYVLFVQFFIDFVSV